MAQFINKRENVVIEAIRSGVPVIASAIDGNVGLLGDGYAGYFPAGDADALPPDCRISSAIASARWIFECACTMTWQSALASARAIALPMSPLPPAKRRR